MKRTLALAAVLVVALAGCAPTEDIAAPDPAPTVAEPTPTPTATQAAETGDVRPPAVFGGSCESVLPLDELSSITGTAMTVKELKPRSFAAEYAVAQVGGMNCTWSSEPFILASVVPEGVASSYEPRGCGDLLADMGGDVHCDFDITVNATRFTGLVSFDGATLKQANARLDKMLALFTSQAENAEPVPAPIPAPESWSNPTSCDSLETLVSDSTILNGSPNPRVGGAPGRGAYYTPVERELRGILSDPRQTECQIFTKGALSDKQIAKGMIGYLGIDIVGGAAWAQDDIAILPNATETTIDGADLAFLIDDTGSDGYGEWFAVFDGPNYLSVRVDDTTAGRASITRILDAVNAGN